MEKYNRWLLNESDYLWAQRELYGHSLEECCNRVNKRYGNNRSISAIKKELTRARKRKYKEVAETIELEGFIPKEKFTKEQYKTYFTELIEGSGPFHDSKVKKFLQEASYGKKVD